MMSKSHTTTFQFFAREGALDAQKSAKDAFSQTYGVYVTDLELDKEFPVLPGLGGCWVNYKVTFQPS